MSGYPSLQDLMETGNMTVLWENRTAERAPVHSLVKMTLVNLAVPIFTLVSLLTRTVSNWFFLWVKMKKTVTREEKGKVKHDNNYDFSSDWSEEEAHASGFHSDPVPVPVLHHYGLLLWDGPEDEEEKARQDQKAFPNPSSCCDDLLCLLACLPSLLSFATYYGLVYENTSDTD
ncbi:UNVERIFIED_CONTAM: hypothetical protein K2H54_024479 [Gekko kuhli]